MDRLLDARVIVSEDVGPMLKPIRCFLILRAHFALCIYAFDYVIFQ